MADEVEIRLASLEARVEFLEQKRPGKKPRPILVSQQGVCGIDPKSDAASCPFASIHYHQKGCRGDRCEMITTQWWADYRAKQKRAK